MNLKELYNMIDNTFQKNGLPKLSEKEFRNGVNKVDSIIVYSTIQNSSVENWCKLAKAICTIIMEIRIKNIKKN